MQPSPKHSSMSLNEEQSCVRSGSIIMLFCTACLQPFNCFALKYPRHHLHFVLTNRKTNCDT